MGLSGPIIFGSNSAASWGCGDCGGNKFGSVLDESLVSTCFNSLYNIFFGSFNLFALDFDTEEMSACVL